MTIVSEARVLDALKAVSDPDLGRDIVALGFVKDLAISDGRVSFVIELTTPACPVKDQMRDQAKVVVSALDGVEAVEIEMTAKVRAAVANVEKAQIPGIKNIIAVGAGKGGVGKTTVSVNLAVALARYGGRVGVIDADVYGPNVPIMLGMDSKLESDGKKIVPAEKYGIRVVSMGFLTDEKAPIIWRGPMLHGVVRQFFQDVLWGELDYLVVDMPPGTGDVALSLTQTVPVTGSIVVTTPQTVSVADSRRAVGMYQKLNVPTLGVIENMSYYFCPECGQESDLFGKGGGERLAEELRVPFLGQIPLYAPIRIGSDAGKPIVSAEAESPVGQAFLKIAERVAAKISIASYGPPPAVPAGSVS